MNTKTITIATLLTTTVLGIIGILVFVIANQQQTTSNTYTVQSTHTILSGRETSMPDVTAQILQQELQDISQRQQELEQTNQILEETIQVLHTEATTISPTNDGTTYQIDITNLPTRKIPTATPNVQSTAVNAILSPQQASSIAADVIQGDQPTDQPHLVAFHGQVAYEVLFRDGIVYIDAVNGEVLYNTSTQQTTIGMTATMDIAIATPVPAPSATVQSSNGQISEQQAKEIAISYVGGGTIEDVDTEDEYGIWVYEVEFTNGSKVYVDVTTGQVVYAKVRPYGQNRENEHESEHGHKNRTNRP